MKEHVFDKVESIVAKEEIAHDYISLLLQRHQKAYVCRKGLNPFSAEFPKVDSSMFKIRQHHFS